MNSNPSSNILHNHQISRRSKTDSLLIILFFSTFRLPVLFASPIDTILNIAFIGFFALILFLRLPSLMVIKNININYFFLVITFLVWGQIGYLRALLNGHFDLIPTLIAIIWQWLIVILSLVFISSAQNKYDITSLLRATIIGAGVYVFINFILGIFGIQANDYEEIRSFELTSLVLELIGFGWLVINPPLSSSPRAIASICVIVAMVFSTYFSKYSIKSDKYIPSKVIVLISIFFLATQGARMALAALLFTYLVIIFFKKRRVLFFTKSLIIFAPFLPLALVAIAGFLQEYNFLSFLSRNAYDNIATLSNRTYIWAEVINVSSKINQYTIIGYGINGHIPSGIWENISYIFEDRLDNKTHTLHNAVIQMFIDRGIIGVLLLQVVLFLLIDRLSRAGKFGYKIIFAILAVLLLSQTTSIFNVGPIDSLTLLIFLITICSSSFLDKSFIKIKNINESDIYQYKK